MGVVVIVVTVIILKVVSTVGVLVVGVFSVIEVVLVVVYTVVVVGPSIYCTRSILFWHSDTQSILETDWHNTTAKSSVCLSVPGQCIVPSREVLIIYLPNEYI